MRGRTEAVRIGELPSSETIAGELKREKNKKNNFQALRNAVSLILLVAATAILLETTRFPILKIYGTSMNPTLYEGEVVCSIKGSDFQPGDIVGLYSGNKLLVKRIIAGPGQTVDIQGDGTVYVDGNMLYEPYLPEKSYGEVNIEFPYCVPEDHYFVLGDHRATSADSRNASIGCIPHDQIIGRIALRVWPLNKLGPLEE